MRNVRLTKNGIQCTNSSSTVYLDPKKIQNDGVHFVSHAHIDHLPNGGDGTAMQHERTGEHQLGQTFRRREAFHGMHSLRSKLRKDIRTNPARFIKSMF